MWGLYELIEPTWNADDNAVCMYPGWFEWSMIIIWVECGIVFLTATLIPRMSSWQDTSLRKHADIVLLAMRSASNRNNYATFFFSSLSIHTKVQFQEWNSVLQRASRCMACQNACVRGKGNHAICGWLGEGHFIYVTTIYFIVHIDDVKFSHVNV